MKSGETQNSGVVDPRGKAMESPQAGKLSSTREPAQRGRAQSSGNNRDLTDQLMMKVDELERLFADHQLHSPLNDSNLSRKQRTSGVPPGCELTFRDYCKESSINFCFSNDSRGKFYERYMEKRDAKLREEWRTRRAEKVMKLRALQEYFDRISIELKAKLLQPAEAYRSIPGACCRVEKLQSFDVQSSLSWMQQVSLHFYHDLFTRANVL